MANFEPIGARIAKARVAAGLSQAGLAKKLDTGRATIYAWERQRRDPGARWLPLLSRALDVSIAWLVTGREERRS